MIYDPHFARRRLPHVYGPERLVLDLLWLAVLAVEAMALLVLLPLFGAKP